MFEYNITEENNLKWINIKGRIDSNTSKDLETLLKDLTLSGERIIAVNLEDVNYISSTGLRIFLLFQKQLKKVDGEIILCKMTDYVANIFKTTGFDRLFSVISKKEDIKCSSCSPDMSTIKVKETNGISLNIKSYQGKAGTLFSIGTQEPLSLSSYEREHVLSVKPEDIKFGTGLAALGEHYKDYKDYFGETVVINSNLFVYPAVKRPCVDFMLYTNQQETIKYNFFHGFGFNGPWKYILSFYGTDGFIDLYRLIDSFLTISEVPVIGIVFFAESKGLSGMNLKQVPLLEKKPASGNSIFHSSNFSSWINFSIEPEDIDRIVVACGIAVNDKAREKENIRDLVPKDNNFHIHGAIFEQSLFKRDADEFEHELNRITSELEPSGVKHLLGKSMVSHGVAGIIELKG
ncbi:MAG: STAS domain-containing protein [Candidatus Eremiobacterota bacterium]